MPHEFYSSGWEKLRHIDDSEGGRILQLIFQYLNLEEILFAKVENCWDMDLFRYLFRFCPFPTEIEKMKKFEILRLRKDEGARSLSCNRCNVSNTF